MAQFDRSAHAAVVLTEGGTSFARCEACHGNGAKHAEAGGGADTIRSFKELSAADEALAFRPGKRSLINLGCEFEEISRESKGASN